MQRFISVIFIGACLACSGKSGSSADTSAVSREGTSQAANQETTTCALVADSELSDALGSAVERHESPTPKRCVYYTADPLVYADIEIDRESGDASWQGVNAGDSIIEAPQDSLSGIGDMAFFGPRDRLYIKKGSSFAAIEAGFDDKVRARARNIARVVVPKL